MHIGLKKSHKKPCLVCWPPTNILSLLKSIMNKYNERYFFNIFGLFWYWNIVYSVTRKTGNTWNMPGMLFLSNHVSEIHLPNRTVFTVVCAARNVSSLDFLGNFQKSCISLIKLFYQFSYQGSDVTVNCFIWLFFPKEETKKSLSQCAQNLFYWIFIFDHIKTTRTKENGDLKTFRRTWVSFLWAYEFFTFELFVALWYGE